MQMKWVESRGAFAFRRTPSRAEAAKLGELVPGFGGGDRVLSLHADEAMVALALSLRKAGSGAFWMLAESGMEADAAEMLAEAARDFRLTPKACREARTAAHLRRLNRRPTAWIELKPRRKRP